MTRAEKIYRALYDLTGGRFEVIAFYTNVVAARRSLGWLFVPPEHPPAVAIGFKMSLFPARLTKFNQSSGFCETSIEPRPAMHEEWATVVRPQDAERALHAVMEVAYQHAKQLQLRATGRGDTV